MKKSNIKLYSWLLGGSILLGTAIFQSCEKPNFDDVNINIDAQLFKKNVMIQAVDVSGLNDFETEGSLEVEILGKDKDKVITDEGLFSSKAKIANGIVTLAVHPSHANHTEPIKFIAKISGEGFLTQTIPVTIFPEQEEVFVPVSLVNLEGNTDDIKIKKSSQSLGNNGQLEEGFEIKTAPTTTGLSVTKVNLDKGTEFMDEDGNKITGGEIEAQVAYFDPLSQAAASAFPGGFNPETLIGENGEELSDNMFITAGFTSIDMFVGDKEVKQFSKPIAVKMEVSKNYQNPNTLQPIKAGDIIPIWSYSNDDGKWVYHGEGTVATGTGDNFEVSFTTTHLSWYNLDYYGNTCGSKSNFEITMNMPGVSKENGHRLFSTVVYEGTTQPISSWANKVSSWYDGEVLKLYNGPSDKNVQILVYSGTSSWNKGTLLYRSNAFNVCSQSGITISSSDFSQSLPDYQNIEVELVGKCGSNTIKPSAAIYMKTPNQSYFEYKGYVKQGKITLHRMELNKDYEFRTYYGGKAYTHTLNFDSKTYIYDDYELPQEVCDKIL